MSDAKPRTTVVISLWVEQETTFTNPLLFERNTTTIRVEDERSGIDLLRQLRNMVEGVQAEHGPSGQEGDGNAPLIAEHLG